MALQSPPVVKAQLLIRRPVGEVFEAFVNPEITTQFWFTRSSGRLEPGAEVQWDWEMYGVAARVAVQAVEPNRRILIEWSRAGGDGSDATSVEWTFTDRPDGTTLVQIANRGFRGTDDEIVAQAIDSMGGFTSTLAGLKALLEHRVRLNLVADNHPDAHVKPS